MGRSKFLYQIQQYDTQIDNASKRILVINAILDDKKLLADARNLQESADKVLAVKKKKLASAEVVVGDHSLKIDQNQKKLYSGTVTNPKDLEDLQQESVSLNKYLSILEERQLQAMLEMEDAQNAYDLASTEVNSIESIMDAEHTTLLAEKNDLEHSIADLTKQKDLYLSSNDIPDLSTYQSLRKSSGGIAVALMTSNSCSSCGASIPSAVAQEARSPGKLTSCPTCRRILHPG